jgi:uncharacterized LabA/DUF88 family protein
MSKNPKVVAILIDHSNLRHVWEDCRKLCNTKKINYLKLIECLACTEKVLYKAVFLNRGVAGNALCDFFDNYGFETVEKRAKQIVNVHKGVSSKCNLDVDITIVAMQMIFDRDLYPIKPNKIVIVAGDSDFEGLGSAIRSYKINVQFAFLKMGFAKELRDNFPCRTLDNLPIWDKRHST